MAKRKLELKKPKDKLKSLKFCPKTHFFPYFLFYQATKLCKELWHQTPLEFHSLPFEKRVK
jgi:hypothetical protein